MANITNLSPEHEAYNIEPTTSVVFDIEDVSGIDSEDISVTINGVSAILNGTYANGFSGEIEYTADPEHYSVSLFSSYIFPPFVGFTILIESTEFNYYFKTKDISNLLTLSNFVTALASTETFIFAATDSGLDIIDIRTKENIAHVHRTGGFTSIWCKQQYTSSDCVYLGTSDDGVYKILLSDIIEGGDVSASCSQILSIYTTPALSSNNIIALHGNQNNLALLMPNNVNIIISETTKYSHSVVSTISSGYIFITDNDLYFTGNNGLSVKYNYSADWSNNDFLYSVTSSPVIGSNIIKGLFVIVATHASLSSYSLNNTLFIATADGFYIVKEQKGVEATATVVSYGNSGKSYNILDSDICTILIADSKISQRNEGRCFIGTSTGSFYIITISSNSVFSVYTTLSGNYGDFLNSSNLKALTSL
jgi:hypothetical protein